MSASSTANLSAPATRRRGFGRLCGFGLLVLTGLVMVCEGSAYLSYWSLEGRPFSLVLAKEERRLLIHAGPSERQVADRALHTEIHPYLGFSYCPDWPGKLESEDPVTEWGFTDRGRRSPARKRMPNKVIVGILGASVASMFADKGVDMLASELLQSPQYANKEIEFVSLAVGGFKQPQQLMALNYALFMGAEFDVIINIDGLNEIAWYAHENASSGISPLYPIGWHWIVSAMPDLERQRHVGKIAFLTEQRAQWARAVRSRWLGGSVTVNLIWKLRDRQLEAEINEAQVTLQSMKQSHPPYRARGPRPTFRDEHEMLAQLVANWQRASVLLDRTCRANGIRYYHFLQPSQYVPGSKPLTAVERKVAYRDTFPARLSIEKGYPLLRDAGRSLAAQGIRFRDLSTVFARTEKTVYYNGCCHFNREGNELMAAAIARTLLATHEPSNPETDQTSRTAPNGNEAHPFSLIQACEAPLSALWIDRFTTPQ